MGTGKSKAGGGGGTSSKVNQLQQSAERVNAIMKEQEQLQKGRVIDYQNGTVTLANGEVMPMDEYETRIRDLNRRYQEEVETQRKLMGNERYMKSTTGYKQNTGSVNPSVSDLAQRASKETNPNRVLNNVNDSQMGKTFNELSASNKATIKGMLSLNKANVEHLNSKPTNTLSQSIRIGGTRYTVAIGTKSGNVVYSLKKGNKNIVKQGSYSNVANQMALLIKQG